MSGGTVPYLPIYNGRVDIGVPDGGGVLHAIAHPPTVYNTSRVDRAKVLAVSPNAVWLETDPNNADTDGDNVIDGNEDAESQRDRRSRDRSIGIRPTQAATSSSSPPSLITNKASP